MYTKQQIIDEIRRMADANYGVAPGKAAFENETGIRRSDWLGRFWSKWGDAVREAGCEPDKKKTAFEEDILMSGLVALTAELGHFPSNAEITLKKRSDKHFPNIAAFARLGTKAELVLKVASYCEGRVELETVRAACELKIAELAGDDLAEHTSPSTSRTGYVYMIKHGIHYKIGKADDPARRAAQIGLLLPHESVMIHKIETDDPFGVEEYWHRRFDAKRIQKKSSKTEFFKLSPADVQAFKRWKKIW